MENILQVTNSTITVNHELALEHVSNISNILKSIMHSLGKHCKQSDGKIIV